MEQTGCARETITVESVSAERRSLLGIVVALIASAITAVLGVTIGRFTIAPALSTGDLSEWADVGPLGEITEGAPVKRNVVVSQDAGWGRFNSQRLVWINRKGDDIKVYSAVCPHLGCTINQTANGFICPCHGSAWNQEGEKLGGPAPRSMDLLEHRIEGDTLKVRYQYFKQGAAERERIG
jgi:nitrite reductase/ring-hydroxylating ferredoxin subunit